ncbi:MAG: class A beta-lactamase-related serine hydrolase [Chloroflexota bacterium]|nr:class A beta-lactamase-related serine hydrolase [Chloroflexota bacterium]
MDAFAPARAWLPSLPGEAGAFATDADGHALFCEREDELFPSASLIKVPLVMALYADAARGLLDLDERVAVGDRVDGSGVLRHMRDVERLSLRDLAMLGIIVSDNTATNRLIERIGVDRVGERLRDWGCPNSRLSRKMYDFEAAKRGNENVMTARETVSLFARLQRGECEDRATSDAVLAVLEQCQDRTMLLRYLPHATKVAHKTGTLDESRNDAAIVPGERPVILAAFTRKVRDTGAAVSWLGVLGWCAYRAAGNSGEPLPPELARTA